MIDPLAALGLARNIVQFVDFSYNLLCESKALYDSSTGATADNVLNETIATDLNLLNARLTAPSAPGAIPDPIKSLAGQCKDVARDLLDVIDNIKIKGSHKRWKSFIQTLRTVWKKKKSRHLLREWKVFEARCSFGYKL